MHCTSLLREQRSLHCPKFSFWTQLNYARVFSTPLVDGNHVYMIHQAPSSNLGCLLSLTLVVTFRVASESGASALQEVPRTTAGGPDGDGGQRGDSALVVGYGGQSVGRSRLLQV